jgi:lipopolysaccharide heptosyltransferase II
LNKINFLKSIDRIIGKPLVFFLPIIKRNHKVSPKKANKILIIRPGGIGDAVLLIPAINALNKELPDTEIDILSERRNAGIFSLLKNVHRIYLYDAVRDLFHALRNRYDAVIDTEQWHRLSALVTYLTGAPVRIGFDTNERAKLFTHSISYSHDDYEVRSFLNLIKPIIQHHPEFDADSSFLDIASESAFRLLNVSDNAKERIVSIFPGASVAERRWGGEKFGKTAKALSAKGYKVVILGASSEHADADIIKQHAAHCMDLTGKTDLKDVAAILKASRLLLTADSGIMHIAYAVGTPTVALFGSGIEKKWAPQGKGNVIINKHLPCSPCTRYGYTPRCDENMECIASIGVDEVVETVESVLDKLPV